MLNASIFGEVPALPKVDVMILDNVVEHIPSPRQIVSSLLDAYVRPGGWVLVQVPNGFNPLQSVYARVKNTGPFWCRPPAHLNYFTGDTIKQFLESCRLEVTKIEQDFPMELFLLMGKDYVADPAIGRACHEMRVALHDHFERAGESDLLEEFYAALTNLNWGRVTTAYASRL